MGYRYFGRDVVIETGFDDVKSDQKGLVLGATYVLAENTTAELKYFKGKIFLVIQMQILYIVK